jgi:thiamine-monophosphate kinase
MKTRAAGSDWLRLDQFGEDRLLEAVLKVLVSREAVAMGLGDDCAVVKIKDASKLFVLKTDCVVEDVHFCAGTDGFAVGWKAMMRPLSDFAATSALPQFALITLIVPQRLHLSWVKELYRGLRRAANRFDVKIVGGETSVTPAVTAVSTTVAGFVEPERRMSRRGGRIGDDLFVTGRLGGALKRKHLKFIPRIEESRWLTKNFSVHAMMDLSDGLGTDLRRLARASKLGFKIGTEKLPLTRGAKIEDAISEGEDYELLFAISRRDRIRLEQRWVKQFPNVLLTRIGSFSQPSTKNDQLLPSGYVHFQQSG